ncbi:MAG: Hsp20/alpha crystallin family protein [Candidatus Gastranaerophilales bacterium]|nr:Hsp20/alpha crystallin family protein [Candidatus Gastranaerophilales bacterium]
MKFLVKKAPEHFLKTVNDEINSLLNRHFDSYFPEAAYLEEIDKFYMPVEIEDKGKSYQIKAELPGVEKENLDIDIDKNYLIINAKKHEENKEESNNYKRTEFRYGEFSRTVYFPEEIDVEETKATMKNGILEIHAKKMQADNNNHKKLTVE